MNCTELEPAFHAIRQQQRAGQHEKADEICRKTLSQHPQQSEALCCLGSLALRAGEHRLAVDWFNKAIEINPDANCHTSLASSLASIGRIDEAITSYQSAIRLNPSDSKAQNNLGLLLLRKLDVEAAIQCFRRAIDLDSEIAHFHDNLGVALMQQGLYEKSASAFRMAIFFEPNFVEAHDHLGDALKVLGLLEESIASYRQALALNANFDIAKDHLKRAIREKQSVLLIKWFPPAQF